MKKSYITKAAAFLALSLLLSGCGGGASKSAMMDYAAETAAAAPAAVDYNTSYAMEAAPGGVFMEGSYDGGGVYDEYEAKAALTASTGASSTAPSPLANRKLIRNMSMDVETDTFDQLLEEIQKKVTELSGYTEQSDISGNRSEYQSRYAWLTVRIPCDKLDQFVGLVENKGNVTRKSESVQDITLQYSDLESRKKTLTLEQERIWALLEKADTLEAVIALEERLSEIRYELESMESQLKLFDNQVDYSTVNISINEVLPRNFTPTAPETVGERIRKGFSRNITNMGQFVTDLFVNLIVLMPVWIPLAAVIALIILLVKSLKRRGTGRRAGSARRLAVHLPGKTAAEGTVAAEAVADTEPTASAKASSGTEPVADTDVSASAKAFAGTEPAAATDASAGTESPAGTESSAVGQVSDTQFPDTQTPHKHE